MSAVLAYIGLGANLEAPRRQVEAALEELAALPDSRLLARSPLYRSTPLGGPEGQPDYVNAAAAIETTLPPYALLDALQAIEQAHGRVRTVRWGPRTLDLDLLLYGDLVQDDPRLILPHPRLHERAFVLYPLHDIAPALVVPGRGTLAELLERCACAGLERLG
ncbi:MAG TPA: 2-amino-4-hydroxy-6-hydroxymethyldihydropteridine diphosphokinase [Candidatus Competibacteraceae bacterium]|nr:2-amino-4-hydroxy-6-hydroxymethyldihydropteridine diphosphokinase [Candidatus Competibacteraceae bacterium]